MMSEAKEAFIEALRQRADALEATTGRDYLAGAHDVQGQRRVMRDANFNGKWKLVFPKEVIRKHADSLERNDVKQGDWPPFGPHDATEGMEMVVRIREEAQAWSRDSAFVDSIVEAVAPIRTAIEKYGVQNGGVWR